MLQQSEGSLQLDWWFEQKGLKHYSHLFSIWLSPLYLQRSKALYKIQDVFDKNAKETTRQVIKNIYSISGYKMVENKECPPLNDSNDS